MPRSSSDEIRRLLLRHILEGQFEPNQTLPTIASLAKTFTVSIPTVQKAIHALSREGIIEAKRGVGIFVKRFDLQAGRGRRIGLLHPNPSSYLLEHPYPGAVIETLQKELQQGGFTVVPCSLEELDRLALLSSLCKLRLAGLVLFEVDSDVLISELRELRLPVVSMDYDAYRHGISSGTFNNVLGAFQATKHLIQLGHKNIAFMRPLVKAVLNKSISLTASDEERVKGYCVAMEDAGLPPMIREFKNRVSIMNEELLRLFGQRPAPTALVCSADWSAQAAAQCVQQLGFRIPQDLSIVGFGGWGVEIGPGRRLTSIGVDNTGMGHAAARMLLESMGGNQPPQRIVLPTRLLVQDSSGPVPVVAAPPPVLAQPAASPVPPALADA